MSFSFITELDFVGNLKFNINYMQCGILDFVVKGVRIEHDAVEMREGDISKKQSIVQRQIKKRFTLNSFIANNRRKLYSAINHSNRSLVSSSPDNINQTQLINPNKIIIDKQIEQQLQCQFEEEYLKRETHYSCDFGEKRGRYQRNKKQRVATAVSSICKDQSHILMNQKLTLEMIRLRKTPKNSVKKWNQRVIKPNQKEINQIKNMNQFASLQTVKYHPFLSHNYLHSNKKQYKKINNNLLSKRNILKRQIEQSLKNLKQIPKIIASNLLSTVKTESESQDYSRDNHNKQLLSRKFGIYCGYIALSEKQKIRMKTRSQRWADINTNRV